MVDYILYLKGIVTGASMGAGWSLLGYATQHQEDFDFLKFLSTIGGGAIIGALVGVAGLQIEDSKDFIVAAALSGSVTAYGQKLWKAFQQWLAARKGTAGKKK